MDYARMQGAGGQLTDDGLRPDQGFRWLRSRQFELLVAPTIASMHQHQTLHMHTSCKTKSGVASFAVLVTPSVRCGTRSTRNGADACLCACMVWSLLQRVRACANARIIIRLQERQTRAMLHACVQKKTYRVVLVQIRGRHYDCSRHDKQQVDRKQFFP